MTIQKTKSGWAYDCCECGKGAPFGVERPNGDLHYCYECWPSKQKPHSEKNDLL